MFVLHVPEFRASKVGMVTHVAPRGSVGGIVWGIVEDCLREHKTTYYGLCKLRTFDEEYCFWVSPIVLHSVPGLCIYHVQAVM